MSKWLNDALLCCHAHLARCNNKTLSSLIKLNHTALVETDKEIEP